MNSNLKSLFTSAGIVFLYVFATIGIVKLFWNTDSAEKFQGRVVLLGLGSFVFSLLYIVGMYHIVGSRNVDVFYKVLIISQALYCITGLYGYVAVNNNK
jgi:uncharacterized membrane protein